MSTNTKIKSPVILCILDGWGYRESPEDNAVALANTPVFDKLWAACPRSFLRTSGTDVGLPEHQMGNSEVGHTNIGAGRIVFQDLPRIDVSIKNDEIRFKPTFIEFVKKMKASKGACHLMGLLSPGGVHAHQDHIIEMAKLLNEQEIKTYIHGFLDGRDTPPKSSKKYLKDFAKHIKKLKHVQLVTLCGRYYAMDRDHRWQRSELAYDLLTRAKGDICKSFSEGISSQYKKGISDEFITGLVSPTYSGMMDGDGIFMCNFRSDRVRQILAALMQKNFSEFKRKKTIHFSACLGMRQYSDDLDFLMPALFPNKKLTHVLGEVISSHHLTQLRIAETEKYPHVTFFFNGGQEKVYPGEDRKLIPSPQVATYDLKPEMSAREVTSTLLGCLASKRYDLVVLNFANPDMVGHTGSLKAAIKAVETVDHCLGEIIEFCDRQKYCVFITADHGNCEMMTDPQTHQPHTAHTLNKVPYILYNLPCDFSHQLEEGRLADIAPTILTIMGLPVPHEMRGDILVTKANSSSSP